MFVASETAPLAPTAPTTPCPRSGARKNEMANKRGPPLTSTQSSLSNLAGARVGIFAWATSGAGNAVKPGQARYWVDDKVQSGVIVDAHKSGDVAGSSWNTVADPIEFEQHLSTCESLPSSSTGGHDFRIIGVAHN